MKKIICILLALCLLCGALLSCDSGKSTKKYTVSFDTNGGSAVNDMELSAGASFSAPAAPTKEGYVFAGWYEDEELLDEFVFGEMPAKDITLYAKWKTESKSMACEMCGEMAECTRVELNGEMVYVCSDCKALIEALKDIENGGNTENGDSPENGPGERGPDGSWDAVDFGGQRVKIAISTNQYSEATFPAADIYTKGPDTAGNNEVAKEVLARNRLAADDLGITVEYVEKDLTYDHVHEDIRSITMTSAANSPDIYNNDMYGLSRAMVDGLLWNVKNPGEDIKNYFDFNAEGWYTEFMKGMTFDQEKMYLFAGDYFIDMIRMAWVVYVNNDILASNIAKMPSWCDSVDSFYDYVDDGFWDMDVLVDMSGRVFIEDANSTMGVTEKTDNTVGFAMNATTAWVMSAASGVTLYYQDEEDGYRPKVMDTIDDFQKVSNKYTQMTETMGVYWEQETLSSLECFLQGNTLFAISRLGEMGSDVMRDFYMAKGLVPVPKWNADEQEDYRTVIHDQAEIGCILNTAHAFSAASALMQYLNEESDGVIYAYYEKGLKYKYNDDQNSRAMMDLVRASTVSPFGANIGRLCEDLYTGVGVLRGMWINQNSTLSSTFASEKDAYVDCMNRMLEKFSRLD